MFKIDFRTLIASIVVVFLAMTGTAWAAVEVNSADTSQLETVKGIGPSLSGKIIAARKQGAFKDWSDLATRVSGVGDRNSAAFSRAGLTVGGRSKDGAAATGDSPGGKSGGRSASKKGVPDPAPTTLASSTKK